MKKISKVAVNRSAHSQQVNLEKLRNSGVARDNLVLRPEDIIEIPEELDPRMDTFIPKGQKEPVEYYMITIEKNGVVYDASMATFRRMLLVTDEDKLKITGEVNDTLASLSDDEARASYLQGKKLRVKETLKCTNRWTDNPIYMPIFEEI